jgi:glycosyltransferase involved in cell wall biosynthesis
VTQRSVSAADAPRDAPPLITVGVTCYNAEDTIARAVQSALTQSWPNVEIVVVDDASSDRSGAVLSGLEQQHPQVRVVRHPENLGYASASNTLISEARGEFLAFFDDDDESFPDRLKVQFQRIVGFEAAHPGSTVVCWGDREVVPEDPATPPFRRIGIGRLAPEPCGAIVADYALGVIRDDGHHCWGMFGGCTLMARTAALRELGGFDPAFRRAEDLEFAVRAARAGACFVSANQAVIRQHLTSGPDKSSNMRLHNRLLLVRTHKEYLKSRRSYLGCLLNTYAEFHRGEHHARWRLWRAAAVPLLPQRWSSVLPVKRVNRRSL